MPDAVEAAWQDVDQEAADELVGGQRHDLLAFGAIAAVVFVSERHAALVKGDEPPVRDGDAVRVAREIGQHCLRSGKGRLHYPNGDKYVGEFRNNMRHGVGALTSNGQRTHGIFKHDQRVKRPDFLEDLEEQDGAPMELPFAWRLSPEDPEIEEERDMMAGTVDYDGRVLRQDGPFPIGVEGTYPGGPANNLMGLTEADIHLSLCARRKPRFLDTVYDLFSSGDFFSH